MSAPALKVTEFPPNTGDQKKETIFVLDDDPVVIKTLEAVMASTYNISSFDSVSELIIHAEGQHPHAILLDLHMPNVDGFEALSLLRNHPATNIVPIICISSDDTADTRTRINQLGASGFLGKPFKIDRLNKDLSGLLLSLNQFVKSPDDKASFFIGYNSHEKYKWMHSQLHEYSKQDGTIILLNWLSPKDFLLKEEEELINSEKLIYLEIKPSLIVKFPYITDLSPVLYDIEEFIQNVPRPRHLIFDEVRNLINIHDSERALAKTYQMANALRTTFDTISLPNTKPQTLTSTHFLQKIARIFVGDDQ